jgi:hypothetical protein
VPIGSRGWHWFEPRLRSGATGAKAGPAALLVLATFAYVFLGPLVFDAPGKPRLIRRDGHRSPRAANDRRRLGRTDCRRRTRSGPDPRRAQPGQSPRPPSTRRSASRVGRPRSDPRVLHRRAEDRQITQYGYATPGPPPTRKTTSFRSNSAGAPQIRAICGPSRTPPHAADGRPTGAHTKDGFETKLKSEVCAGTITLAPRRARSGITGSTPTTASRSRRRPRAQRHRDRHRRSHRPSPSSPPTRSALRFVSLPDPAPLGGVAHLEADLHPERAA